MLVSKPSPSAYVTQKDIARLANVSQSAVAAALGRTTKIRISQETREKILRAAAQLNYLPNESASNTRRGRTGQVALLMRGLTTDATATRVQRLSARLLEEDFRVVPLDLMWNNAPLEEAWDLALAARPEAIVLSSSFGTIHPPMYKRLLSCPVPVVSLCGPHIPGIPLIAPDYRGAFGELTRELIRSGRENLVMLKRFRKPDPISQIAWKGGDRVLGFLDAVAEHGLERSAKVMEVWNKTPERPKNEYELGQLGFEEALEARRGKLPDAVICANDRFAFGAMSAATRRGIALPAEMSLTGCDGETWTGYGMLPLTTIRQPSEALGDAAAETVIRLLQGGTVQDEPTLLPCSIQWQASCPREHGKPRRRSSQA